MIGVVEPPASSPRSGRIGLLASFQSVGTTSRISPMHRILPRPMPNIAIGTSVFSYRARTGWLIRQSSAFLPQIVGVVVAELLFDDAEYEQTAKSFDNPDFVEVMIHSYRHS